MTNLNKTGSNWVIRSKLNPQAILRLFCFPYAGSSALVFRTWSEYLPASVEVCAVELPGRGTRFTETPFTCLKSLVEESAIALLPYLDKPFAFFGHSMGALVSFELSRLFRQKYSLSPLHLFVSAHRAPQIPNPNLPIYTLPEPALLQELCHLNGTPKAVLENAELIQLLLPIFRADFEAIETYIYQAKPPLECPITAFGGLSDTQTNIEQLEAWANQTTAAFSLQMLKGDHFFLYSAQSQLLQYITQQLQSLASITTS